MYAEVIVDVNNHSVDQSFYYLIPEEFTSTDLVGYRVEVPFGSRIVQGYIINIINEYIGEYDKNNFKSIKKVKDDFPILTKEMLLLSKVMSD